MFAHGFNESNASAISLVDISYPVFIALVRFLYTDNIPPPSVEALVLPLLQQVPCDAMPLVRIRVFAVGRGENDQAALCPLLERARSLRCVFWFHWDGDHMPLCADLVLTGLTEW